MNIKMKFFQHITIVTAIENIIEYNRIKVIGTWFYEVLFYFVRNSCLVLRKNCRDDLTSKSGNINQMYVMWLVSKSIWVFGVETPIDDSWQKYSVFEVEWIWYSNGFYNVLNSV